MFSKKLNNQREGRCITLGFWNLIHIGYCKDGGWTVGNFISIWIDGDIHVGDYYLDGIGWITGRHTWYKTDGTSKPFGDNSAE